MTLMPISSLPSEVLDAYGGAPIPALVRMFYADGDAGVAYLLLDYQSELHPNEPQVVPLVMPILQVLSETEFVGKLDRALSLWIRSNFGALPAASTSTATHWAEAWTRAFDIVGASTLLTESGAAVRAVQAAAFDYLSPLSKGRALDPYWSFLIALARHQVDDSLRPLWYQLCALRPDGTQHYYGRAGIAGLRGLPRVDDFPSDAVAGTVQFARALYAAQSSGIINAQMATREFRFAARELYRAFPLQKAWRERVGAIVQSDEPIRAWFDQVIPGIRWQELKKNQKIVEPFWRPRVAEVENIFAAGSANKALQAANLLLIEQRSYAESSGDSERFVYSLCNFANRSMKHTPTVSLAWAKAAFSWGRDNPYAWTTLARAYFATGDLIASEGIIWETTERFPRNGVGWVLLIQFLRRRSRDDALVASEEAVRHVPDNASVLILKGVLLNQSRRWVDAEGSFRAALRVAPAGVSRSKIFVGLARSLRGQGELQAAAQAYQEALDDDERSLAAYLGIANLRRQLGNLAGAEQALLEGLPHVGPQPGLLRPLTEILEDQGRGHELNALVVRAGQISRSEPGGSHDHGRHVATLEAEASADDFVREEESDHGAWELDEAVSGADPELSEDESDVEIGTSVASSDAGPTRLDGTTGVATLTDQILAAWPDQNIQRTEGRSKGTAAALAARLVRRQAPQTSEEGSGDRLQRGLELLRIAESHASFSARVSAERILLLSQEGHVDAAMQEIERSAMMTGSPARWLAIGRLRQHLARADSPRYSTEAFDYLVSPYHAASALLPSLQPLGLIADVRACRAMHDGAPLAERTEVAEERLSRRLNSLIDSPMREHGERFESWWALQVRERTMAVAASDGESQLAGIDLLEEDLVFRVGV